MKIVTLTMSVLVLIAFGSCTGSETNSVKVDIVVKKDSYKTGEKDALIVLKAYADKDLETLKSYAGGAQKMVMDETYFDGQESFMEGIENWTGSFNQIRYDAEEINFQHFYYITAVFYESPTGQLTAIKLKSLDKEKWKLSGFGKAFIKKEEFNKMSKEIP